MQQGGIGCMKKARMR